MPIITVRVSDKQHKRIKEYCKVKKITVSKLLRGAALEAIFKDFFNDDLRIEASKKARNKPH